MRIVPAHQNATAGVTSAPVTQARHRRVRRQTRRFPPGRPSGQVSRPTALCILEFDVQAQPQPHVGKRHMGTVERLYLQGRSNIGKRKRVSAPAHAP